MKNKAYLLTAVGRPGRGKTALMISTINLALADNKKVLFYSLECGREIIESSFSETKNLTIKDKPIKEVKTIYDDLLELKPDVVFIDYLELLPKYSIEHLKQITQRFNIKVIVNSQLGRKYIGINSKDEIMNQLKEEYIYKISDKCLIV